MQRICARMPLSSLVVLVALILVTVTGAQWIDPVAALLVAAAIVVTGVRLLVRAGEVLVDQALPAEEIADDHAGDRELRRSGVIGFHELRTRRGGSQRYVDVHIQFRQRDLTRAGASDCA